ncbi:MAG: hypothetical protein NXY57DRAFT_978995 [Lentinula lateritia]|nr:MAG: hypothetical protein NXY57DRAFT_978995 [Lentinula lateritia]
MATATLNSLVENFETLQEAMRSSIECMKRGYANILCSGRVDDSVEFFSPCYSEVLSLQRLTQILKCKIFLATLEKPLVDLAIVLPSMDSTCRLLFSTLCDLYTNLLPVAQRTKLEIYMALIRGPNMTSSMEMEAYSLVFAPPLTQIVKITDILRTLKKERKRSSSWTSQARNPVSLLLYKVLGTHLDDKATREALQTLSELYVNSSSSGSTVDASSKVTETPETNAHFDGALIEDEEDENDDEEKRARSSIGPSKSVENMPGEAARARINPKRDMELRLAHVSDWF